MPRTQPVVFISSTSRDLRDHREAAARAARQAGFHAVIMEEFEAQSLLPPYPACMAKVRECDVLVVLVAHRYGWVPSDQPEKGTKSITWLECEEILRPPTKELLAFVVDPDHPWPPQHKEAYRATEAMEKGKFPAKLQKEIARDIKQLSAFKAWIEGLGFRKTFTDHASVNSLVQESLNKWKERHPHSDLSTATNHDPAEYLRQLREQTRWIDIRGLQVGTGKAYRFPIDDLYIPLTTAGGETPEAQARKGRGRGQAKAGSMNQPRTVLLEEVLNQQHLVIAGDPGAGKTTFLRRIAYELCRDDGRPALRLPVRGFPFYLRVGDLEAHVQNCRKQNHGSAPPTDHHPQWLAHYIAGSSPLDRAFVEAKFRTAGTTVFLDGLDEATNTQAREAMARLVSQAVTAYPECRFVVTTRPMAYRGNVKLPGFHEVRIAELEAGAIDGFLGHWSKGLYPADEKSEREHRKALGEALNARPEIRRMAKNPVMLTALAVVHWNERRLPEQRADLYESITVWLARAKEAKAGRETADRVLKLLGHLALGMQTQAKGRITQVSKATAAQILAPQFREAGDENEQLARARAFLEAEEVDSGILVSRGADLRFWHLTLQEYLVARTVAGLTDASQHGLLFADQRLYQTEWREVMLLFGGTLINQGTDKVDALFGEVLKRVKQDASLAEKARCVALIGAMLADLGPYSYKLPHASYEQMLEEVRGIFEKGKAEGIEIKVRVEAAEALGQAGDWRFAGNGEDRWITLPAGTFLMGAQKKSKTKPGYDPEANDHEGPVREVTVAAFQMGKYPVTVGEYQRFVEDEETGYGKPSAWRHGWSPKGAAPEGWDEQVLHPNRPVVSVNCFEAMAYCDWAELRLPTEAEWEYAARGSEGRKYPWGHEAPNTNRANSSETKIGSASPVGLFPGGATPEGILDLAGNVWEWCADGNKDWRGLRGGSWYGPSSLLRAAVRGRGLPGDGDGGVGFRCAREVPSL